MEQKEFFLSCKRVVQSPGKETRFPCSVWGFSGYFFVCFVLLFLLPGAFYFFFFPPFSLEPREGLECVFVKAAACKGLNPSFGSIWLLASSPHSTGTSFFPRQKSGSLHLGTGGFCRTILGSGSGLSAPKSTFSPVYIQVQSALMRGSHGRERVGLGIVAAARGQDK